MKDLIEYPVENQEIGVIGFLCGFGSEALGFRLPRFRVTGVLRLRL